MTVPAGAGDAYDCAHVREALARDPRVGELDLQVRIVAGKVFVDGSVPTEERRRAVSSLITELLPGFEIGNDVAVAAGSERPGVEHIA